MNVFMKKSDILIRLEKNLAAAKAEDEATKQRHIAEEIEVHDKFRRLIGAALKWDYKTAKKNDFTVRIPYSDVPRCPLLRAAPIERIIRDIKADIRERMSVSPGTDLHNSVFWEASGAKKKTTVCD